MNITNSLLDHYATLEKEFHREFAALLLEGSARSVHQLRVNLKKQLAFFHLLEALDPSFSTERATQAFSKIYRKAGKVRNLQVEKGVVAKIGGPTGQADQFMHWLEERECQRRERLHEFGAKLNLVPVRRLSHRVGTHIRFLNRESLSSGLIAYLSGLLDSAADLLRPENLAGEKLHDLRRIVKELFFNLRFVDNISKGHSLLHEDIKYLDRLQQQLGNWHDLHASLLRIGRKQRACCPSEIAVRIWKAYSDETENIRAGAAEAVVLMGRLKEDLNQEPPRHPHAEKKAKRRLEEDGFCFPKAYTGERKC